MHSAASLKEKSSPFIFIPILLISMYLVYLVVNVAYNIGVEEGQIVATYRGPVQEEDDEAQVFNHQQLVKPSEELVNLGNSVYRANCASCHGSEGLGNGAAGQNLSVKPRSFKDAPETWTNGASSISMYNTLENGLGQMPNFPALNPEQKYAVIHYIHAEFMDGEYPENTEEQLASLPAPSAGGGGVNIDPYVEERIPVNMAIDKLVRESGNSK